MDWERRWTWKSIDQIWVYNHEESCPNLLFCLNFVFLLVRGLSTVPTLPSAEAELFRPFDVVRADELRLRAAAFWIPRCSACCGMLAKLPPTGFKSRWISKPINQIQDDRYNREAKRVHLLFCLNFFFLQAHELTALMKPPPDERDTAGAEPFCPLNIFRVVELGLGAATSRTSSSKSSTCAGFPRGLEQTDAFKIPTSNPTCHIEASSHTRMKTFAESSRAVTYQCEL